MVSFISIKRLVILLLLVWEVIMTLIDIYCDAERGNESRRSTVSSRNLSARVGSFSEFAQNQKRGMILPFEPHSITFDEIRYAVDMPQVI